MRIAVNTRFLLSNYLEGYGNFIFQNFMYLTHAYPEHQFIFIFDRPYDKRFVFSQNIIPVVAGPSARHPVLWKYWYDVKIPAVLKKYKADIFVSPDGFCSLATKVPQCIVVHDLAFLHYPSHIRKSHLLFFRKYTPAYLQKAKMICTVSEYTKKDILDNYNINSDKIDVVYNAVRAVFQPVSGTVKEMTKEKYTNGREYFVHVGAIHPRKNLVNLLKAFSIFKKRQKSNLRLALVGRLAWKYDSFIRDLRKYKYKEDVLLLGYLTDEELANVMASAYALVYPSLFEGFGVPVLEAMRCNVPVITSENSSMQEMAKDAALYVDAEKFESIAEKMMLIYKDENLRSQLIGRGKIIASDYSWERTAGLLWQSIQKAVS